MTSQWLAVALVVVLYTISWVLGLTMMKRARLPNEPKQLEENRIAALNTGYRNVEDWLKVALATPDEGICSHCGTYGPYDHVSACYRGMQMCFWCAELERERKRVES